MELLCPSEVRCKQTTTLLQYREGRWQIRLTTLEIYILFSGSKKLLNTLKKKEILIYAATWKNLEDIMLSEINQSQKDSV